MQWVEITTKAPTSNIQGGADSKIGDAPTNPRNSTSVELSDELAGRLIDELHASNTTLRRAYMKCVDQVADATDAELASIETKMTVIGNKFVAQSTGLAGAVWRRYVASANQAHVEDFIGSALEALWRSFLTWDPEKGTFGTWSRQHLTGAVRREVNFHERPHQKYHENNLRRSADSIVEAAVRKTGVAPSDEAVADKLGVSVELLRESRRKPHVSLDAPVGDGSTTRGDLVASDGIITSGVLAKMAASEEGAEALQTMMKAITAQLSPLELYLVLVRQGLHGWEPETVHDIADATGIGREILRRRGNKAIASVEAAAAALSVSAS